VIALEIGAVTRFPTAEKLARDAGCPCRVHATGGTLRDGRLRPDVNRYLKWAFIEAANALGLMRRRHPHRHVSRLYERIAGARAIPRPSAPWRGISQKPRIGCSANRNRIESPRRPPFRLRGIRATSP
jgi:Transposase IS116/IS110/IS902 family